MELKVNIMNLHGDLLVVLIIEANQDCFVKDTMPGITYSEDAV